MNTFRPLAVAFALLFALPPLSWLLAPGNDGTEHTSLFSAPAQIATHCKSSPNQILQTACQLPILSQFELTAVQTYLALHSLPVTDAAYIYAYGGSELRNEIRSAMLELFLADASQDPSQLDDVQLNAYDWFQAQVQNEEKQYWAAAAAEYNSWNANKCAYKLDADVAAAQGLEYDPAQWCYPNLANYFSTPPVPTYNYFLAVAWKNTYGSLLSSSVQNSFLLLNVQRDTTQYAALYALPASFAAGLYLSKTVAIAFENLFPYASEAFKSTVPSGVSYGNRIAQTAETVEEGLTQQELDQLAADAGEFVGDFAPASVVGIVIFAIETAVQAGIDAVNTQQTLDQIATLPAIAAQIAQNPPSLASMLTTQDGFTKASTVWVAQTIPDSPSTADASSASDGSIGAFYNVQTGASSQVLTYLDSSNKQNVAALRGGWFINEPPGANAFQFVGAIDYLDWNGNPRFATRVGPFQFLIWRPQGALPGDVSCPASASDNYLSPVSNPGQCFSYVTNALEMKDPNGNNVAIQLVPQLTMTSPSYADFQTGETTSFQVTFSPPVNDVPCIALQSGILPPGVNYSASKAQFYGSPLASVPSGVYNETVILQCGGSQGVSTPFPFQVIVGAKNLQFTSPTALSTTFGAPVNFLVTTVGFPIPKLTSNYLPGEFVFTDNGNGTASITSQWAIVSGECLPGPCPTPTITANNGLQQITENLNVTISPPPPLQFIAPAQGSTLKFPVGVYTSYPVFTQGGAPAQLSSEFPTKLIFSGAPSWMTVQDNGNGIGSISGTPPLNAAGTSAQITVSGEFLSLTNQPGLADSFTVSVVDNPNPLIQVLAGSMAFLAGSAGGAELTSNIQGGTGLFLPAEPLPPGLSFNLLPVNPLCSGNCPVNAVISGTPPAGSGGDYKVPFTLTNSTGTTTQILDIAIYEKPGLASSNRIIFYAGQPASATVSASGFPLKPIGPFSDGVGYSGGATFSDPLATLPSFLKLVSGLGSTQNGTATLTSSASASNLGLYPIALGIAEQAAPSPFVTNPATQLFSLVNLSVYVVPAGDANLDFKVDCADLSAIKAGFGKVRGQQGYDSALDLNGDGIINVRDLAIAASKLQAGTRCMQ
ncbi:MAG: hypothetical protein JO051_08615 [Acidobacteriaceae bacterium]|nr:hypothetical protein [Acidobacteriaceae bacterium]